MKKGYSALDFVPGNHVTVDGERFCVSYEYTNRFNDKEYLSLSRPHTLQLLGSDRPSGVRYVRHRISKIVLLEASELAQMLNTKQYQVDNDFSLRNGWKFMKDVPTSGEPIFVWLASPFKGSNIHVANFVNGRRLIDGHIQCDAPEAVAWQPVMGSPV